MAAVVLDIISGELFDSNSLYFHIINSVIICSAPIMTILLFNHIPALKYFNNDDCSPWIYTPVHYLISSGLLMLSVFVLGLFVTIHIEAYRNVIVAYTQGYIIVIFIAIIIDVHKVAVANKNLLKIQISRRRANKVDGGISNEKNN